MDPYHLAGSGSVSNDTDPDPGSAEKFLAKTNQNHKKKKKILKNTIYMKKKNYFITIFLSTHF